MNLSPEQIKEQEIINQGKAIARGIAEQNAQKDRNMAKMDKRKQTMLENAARDVFRNY